MKIAVVYTSLTGNTERLAKGIYDRIPEKYEKTLFNLKENPDISDYDIVATGFWIDRSYPYKPMGDFISKIKNKKIFLFGTMGYLPDSVHGERCIQNVKNMVDKSNKIIGYFVCNGKIDKKLYAALQRFDDDTPGMKAFKAHMKDQKNLARYKIMSDHVNIRDIEFGSDRFNERVKIEEAISNIE